MCKLMQLLTSLGPHFFHLANLLDNLVLRQWIQNAKNGYSVSFIINKA